MLKDCSKLMTQWRDRVGDQRDWIWRGWQIRYSFAWAQEEQGEPPLFLVHGFGAALEHWRHNIPVLRRDRAIYALDLLGFGGSRKATVRYRLDLWAAQLYDFWQAFIGVPVVLVGNSLGSLACTLAAQRYPEMVRGLVLINLPDVSLRQEMMPSGWGQQVATSLENALSPRWFIRGLVQFLRQRSVIRRWVKIAYPRTAAVTDELVEILSAPAYDTGAGDTLWALSRSLRSPEFSPNLAAIIAQFEIPILLLWGERDRMVPFALAGRFKDLNPRLTFVPLPEAGHCPHDEMPERFHEILLPWLTQFAGTRTAARLSSR